MWTDKGLPFRRGGVIASKKPKPELEDLDDSLDIGDPPGEEPDDSQNDMLSDLFAEDSDVEQKLVHELVGDENLEKKTELQFPLRWSVLTVIQEQLDQKAMPKSSQILSHFRETAFKYLISHDRKSRAEYIDALKAISNSISEKKTNAME